MEPALLVHLCWNEGLQPLMLLHKTVSRYISHVILSLRQQIAQTAGISQEAIVDIIDHNGRHLSTDERVAALRPFSIIIATWVGQRPASPPDLIATAVTEEAETFARTADRLTTATRDLKDKLRRLATAVLLWVPIELKDSFSEQIDHELHLLEHQPRTVVCVYGKTHAGKSTLLNRLLKTTNDNRLLSNAKAESQKSTTAYCLKLQWAEQYSITFYYLRLEEWRAQKIAWADDLKKSHSKKQQKRAQAAQALNQLRAIYGPEATEFPTEDPPELSEVFLPFEGKGRRFTVVGPRDIERLQQEHLVFRGQLDFRYLIRSATIQGPLDLLKAVTLVDMPGQSDQLAARSDAANQYRRQCTHTWLLRPVADPIATNDDLVPMLKELLRDVDPETFQRITYIGTKADYSSAVDEDTGEKLPVNKPVVMSELRNALRPKLDFVVSEIEAEERENQELLARAEVTQRVPGTAGVQIDSAIAERARELLDQLQPRQLARKAACADLLESRIFLHMMGQNTDPIDIRKHVEEIGQIRSDWLERREASATRLAQRLKDAAYSALYPAPQVQEAMRHILRSEPEFLRAFPGIAAFPLPVEYWNFGLAVPEAFSRAIQALGRTSLGGAPFARSLKGALDARTVHRHASAHLGNQQQGRWQPLLAHLANMEAQFLPVLGRLVEKTLKELHDILSPEHRERLPRLEDFELEATGVLTAVYEEVRNIGLTVYEPLFRFRQQPLDAAYRDGLAQWGRGPGFTDRVDNAFGLRTPVFTAALLADIVEVTLGRTSAAAQAMETGCRNLAEVYYQRLRQTCLILGQREPGVLSHLRNFIQHLAINFRLPMPTFPGIVPLDNLVEIVATTLPLCFYCRQNEVFPEKLPCGHFYCLPCLKKLTGGACVIDSETFMTWLEAQPTAQQDLNPDDPLLRALDRFSPDTECLLVSIGCAAFLQDAPLWLDQVCPDSWLKVHRDHFAEILALDPMITDLRAAADQLLAADWKQEDEGSPTFVKGRHRLHIVPSIFWTPHWKLQRNLAEAALTLGEMQTRYPTRLPNRWAAFQRVAARFQSSCRVAYNFKEHLPGQYCECHCQPSGLCQDMTAMSFTLH